MRRTLALAGLVVAVLVGPAVVLGATGKLKPLASIANRAWPAPVKAAEPAMPPPLPPAQAMKTFYMPPGYHLELVAAEPLVKDPILLEFDGDGRLWVMEMHGFAINEKLENSLEPINDLVILEDTNADGVFDKRTVFMDKLILPRAFKILDKNCALVGEPPNLWKACDTNGDLKSDTKELVDKTFSTQGVVEHGANGLYWGMDNTIYVSEHTWNLRQKDGSFSIEPSLNRGQWGVTQDDGGRIYRNVNTDPLFVDYVAPRYYARNPNMVRTNGLYQSLVKQEDTLIWPVHPTPGLNRGYRSDIFRKDGTATYYGGVSSPLIYRGDRLPKLLQGEALVVDGPTNIVHLLNLKDDGTGQLSATDYYKKGEFLASTDVRFRPVALSTGWDGAIYIADMYRGVSQDGPIQTDYLRDYTAKHGLAKHINLGRIYRVVSNGMVPDKKPAMSKETPAQLVAHLSHPSGWWRDTAQQLLVQRGDKSVAPALKALVAGAPAAPTRLQALWTLDGLGVLDPATVQKALADASPDVRASAVRLSEGWIGDASMRTAVLKTMDDPNWFVRRQLAATVGLFPGEARTAAMVSLLRKFGDDPIAVDAAISGLGGQEPAVLAQLLAQPSPPSDAVAMLAGSASKGRDPDVVQAVLGQALDANRPAPIRVAMLKGLALGLQGAGGGGGGNAVVGGRAGAAVPGVQARRGGAAQFELATAPTALVGLAEGSGEAADAARQVAALISWPGKPAAATAVAMTADEQKRFAAGKPIYDATCSGCHQPEGQGMARVAAPLAGSALVKGPADPVIRVLTNGKEGSVGLMPPLGAAMSDDDLAAVLTYIRRSWGNTGAPVLPAEVKETRQAYAHRTTPWTDEELAARRR